MPLFTFTHISLANAITWIYLTSRGKRMNQKFKTRRWLDGSPASNFYPKIFLLIPNSEEISKDFLQAHSLFCIGCLTLDRTVNNIKNQVPFLVLMLLTPVLLLHIKRILSSYLYQAFPFSCLFYAFAYSLSALVRLYFLVNLGSAGKTHQALRRYSKEHFESFQSKIVVLCLQKESKEWEL